MGFMDRIGGMLAGDQHKNGRRAAFACAAVLALGGTAAGLKFYGQALNAGESGWQCGIEIHEHTDACFSQDTGEVVCGYADFVLHTHDTMCYDGNGDLSCLLPEHEIHEHGEGCYETQVTFSCEQSQGSVSGGDAAGTDVREPVLTCETPEHTHGDSCYEISEAVEPCSKTEHIHDDSCSGEILACDESEHVHGGDCISEDGGPCSQPEHSHGEDCYETVSTCDLEEHTHDGSCAGSEGGRVLTCQAEEHVHDGFCSAQADNPSDDGVEAEAHVHTDACRVETEILVCREQDVMHVHDDSCFSDDGILSCGLVEILSHQHDESCRPAGSGDGQMHFHDETCFGEDGDMLCGYDREHAHKPACYDEAGRLVCNYGTLKHVHVNDCYGEDGRLTCGYDAAAHAHTDACYDGNGDLACGYESEPHMHDESCYDGSGNLTCGLDEARHEHDESCYDGDGDLICDYKTHAHEFGCYDENGNVVCGYGDEPHEHDDSCYDENGGLTCCFGLEGAFDLSHCLDHIHRHTDSCFDENGDSACGKADYAQHAHDLSCLDAGHVLICQVPENHTDTHSHGDACYSGEALICGQLEVLEHIHSDICGTEPEAGDTTRVFEGDGFTVTVVYGPDAEIPDDAELICGIVEDGADDGGNYKNRLEQYRSAMGSENARMRALLKIGFYLNDAEIEPEAPVRLSVQFYDQNGEPEGPVLNAVHFTGDTGADVLDGEFDDSGVCQFHVPHFSEIAFGYGDEDMVVSLDERIFYDAGELQVLFDIKGDVVLPDTADDNQVRIPDGAWTYDTDDGGSGRLLFAVSESDTASDAYLSVEAYANAVSGVPADSESGPDDGPIVMKVWDFGLYFDGAPVDLSDCEISASVMPSEALAQEAVQAILSADGDGIDPELEPYRLDAMAVDPDGQALEPESLVLDENVLYASSTFDMDAAHTAAVVDLTGMSSLGAAVSGQPNPKFTVQYYANLDRVAYNDKDMVEVVDDKGRTNVLQVIDTTGGQLPQNQYDADSPVTESPNGNEIRNLYVDVATGCLKTVSQVTEVYAARDYEYHKAPTLNYFNALVENASYELREVWVLKDGFDASAGDDGWEKHPYSDRLHFTNRPLSGGTDAEGHTWLYIRDGAVIRLLYDTTSNDTDFEAAFYDYDITDGHVYDTYDDVKEVKNAKPTSQQSEAGVLQWARTDFRGINSDGNYPEGTQDARLAFGNMFTGTGLQFEMWNGNLLNMGNKTYTSAPAVSGSYNGLTFGIANGLRDGHIVYADGIAVPNLFNEGGAVGKTAYDLGEYSLRFGRDGDTYTLKAVNGTQADGLDSFGHPSPNDTTVHYHIWTNDFWPMDSAASWGADGHDMKWGRFSGFDSLKFFGKAGSTENLEDPNNNRAAQNGVFSHSDDGKDHNSYFGMHYKVQFDLAADYVGPLEYYFFGDDDMWVFFGDGDGNGELVCDIGGVHPSVGEYLNLWDYIDKEEDKLHVHADECYSNGDVICGYTDLKSYTLNFFYTERGASGSTCYMQFTLPTVTSLTPETTDKDYGHLEIRKTVKIMEDGAEHDVEDDYFAFMDGEPYKFTLSLNGPDGKPLRDDYAYVRYDKNGNQVADGGGILAWNVIADGQDFELKNGEHILIRFLPAGSTYTIKESEGSLESGGVSHAGTEIRTDGVISSGLTANGSISQGGTSETEYINRYSGFRLPETGGSGIILYAMAGGVAALAAGFLYRRRKQK